MMMREKKIRVSVIFAEAWNVSVYLKLSTAKSTNAKVKRPWQFMHLYMYAYICEYTFNSDFY